MLKALALTLLIATFLASGFSLAPAESMSQGLTRTETFVTEKLTLIPVEDEGLVTVQKSSPSKTDRETTPKT
jgi:hypothetical protein